MTAVGVGFSRPAKSEATDARCTTGTSHDDHHDKESQTHPQGVVTFESAGRSPSVKTLKADLAPGVVRRDDGRRRLQRDAHRNALLAAVLVSADEQESRTRR